MSRNKLAAVFCALLLSGCASSPAGDKFARAAPADGSAAADEEQPEVIGADTTKWVCKTEKITGSHRIERICYSREVAESLRETAQDGMYRRMRNKACTSDCNRGG